MRSEWGVRIDSPEYAARLDAADVLSGFRSRFEVDDYELIYLDGNSLGRPPSKAIEAVGEEMIEWRYQLVSGWPRGWVDLPARLGSKIARIIGVQPNEVAVCDSTSVNLFKLVSAALDHQSDRSEIVTDDLNFPSDLYVMQGCASRLGKTIRTVPSADGVKPDIEGLLASLSDQTALLCVTHVAFKSGALYPMKKLTEAAHRVGALVLWDLSHSVGAVPLDLGNCGVDLAVGCTYKYLNGGPGSPAFLYVREDLQGELRSPVWGWFGQSNPFDFDLGYSPADGIARFFAGTPPILSMVGIEAGVDLIIEAGIDRLRAKSITQTSYFIELYDLLLAPLGFRLQSPRKPEARGSHVSIGHDAGWPIDQALIKEMNVIPDFRAPDNLRYGMTPLYTTFEEVRQGAIRTAEVVETRAHEKYGRERAGVT